MITCPVCSAQISDDAVACPICGATVDTVADETVGVFNQIPSAPVQPVYEAPAQPAYQAPVQPVYEAPVQPAYQAPVQPTYQAPVQPTYQAPVQPTYQAPVQPAQPGFQQVPYGQAPQQPKKTAMVLGIVAICLGLLIPLVGYCTGIPGIVIGNKEKKLSGDNKGLILSIIGVGVSAAVHLLTMMFMF